MMHISCFRVSAHVNVHRVAEFAVVWLIEPEGFAGLLEPSMQPAATLVFVRSCKLERRLVSHMCYVVFVKCVTSASLCMQLLLPAAWYKLMQFIS